MAILGQQIINIGLPNESANSDSLYTAFNKTKENFANLFACASPYVTFIGGTGISANTFANSGTVSITNTGVTQILAGSGITVSANTGVVTISAAGAGIGTGTVQYVGVIGAGGNARVTVAGSPIVSSGNITLDLANSGVTPGTYTAPILTVDQYGRVVNIANADSIGTVTSVGLSAGAGISINGGPITDSGTITVTNTGVTSLRQGRGIQLSGSNGAITISTTPSTGTVQSVGVSSSTLDVSGGPITTTGTITINLPSNVSILGNLVAGNLVAPLANGNSNINIPTGGGNINLSANGTANIISVHRNGTNITGNTAISGNANITGNLNFTGSRANLGNVSNLTITGGVNGYFLRTNGAGNLSWAAMSAVSSMSNGNSNVVVQSFTGEVIFNLLGGSGNIIFTPFGANIRGNANVTENLLSNNITSNANATIGANTRIYSTPGYIETKGTLLTGRVLGSYAERSSLSANYFFDYNLSNSISAGDSTSVSNLGTILSTNITEANVSTAFGTSYGNRNAGMSFVSGTASDITKVSSGIAPLYTGNINAIVVGYTVNGPRILIQDYSLIDDSANTISHIGQKHILYNGVNTTPIATFTAATTTIAGNISHSGNITSAGNLSAVNLTASANLVVGNIGNIPNLRTAVVYNSTSNVRIASGGNITFSIAGNATPKVTVASNSVVLSSTANLIASGSANITGTLNVGGNVIASSNLTVTSDIESSTGNILANSDTAIIGYKTGNSVTQITDRDTPVTINSVTGSITLVSVAGGGPNTFTVNNNVVSETDVIILNQRSGTDQYEYFITNVSNGSFDIYINTSGTTTEQPVFNFAVIKGADA